MKKGLFVFCFLLLALWVETTAQPLRPGFDKAEYLEQLRVTAQFGDSTYIASFPKPTQFHFVYRSPDVGLQNCWDLWVNDSGVAVISIRGTTQSSVSWLANFYAAMVPAKGELQITDTEKFTYELAENPRAAVHVGWLISTAFMAKDIVSKIDSCYKSGIKNIIISGHSQGGGIAYLLTAYLYNLQKQHQLPADVRFKTYCSAGPKPGNLYFAYAYETMTQNGWSYNVVNEADWVPEVPFSVQTVKDFNNTNPFKNAKALIKQQKFPKNLALRYAYNRLDKPSRRAQRNYQKYLGKMTSKMVKKTIPGFIAPEYFGSNDYVRTGNFIVLKTDEDYYKMFPDNDRQIFIHHLHPPYYVLAQKLDLSDTGGMTFIDSTAMNATWELNYISGKRIAFEGLFPGKKPQINIDIYHNRVSGNTSCNSFSGKLDMTGNRVNFNGPLAMTKMACSGEGESSFLDVLKTVNGWSMADANTLNFMMNDVLVMRFSRK